MSTIFYRGVSIECLGGCTLQIDSLFSILNSQFSINKGKVLPATINVDKIMYGLVGWREILEKSVTVVVGRVDQYCVLNFDYANLPETSVGTFFYIRTIFIDNDEPLSNPPFIAPLPPLIGNINCVLLSFRICAA